jgi:hypothetical protein
MPFLGYIIILQKQLVDFLSPLSYGTIPPDLKPGIGFYFLYFGLFIFGLASFIFHISCPAIIKSFSTADEYVERIESLVTASDLAERAAAILRNAQKGSAIEQQANAYAGVLTMGINSEPQKSMRLFILRNYFLILDDSRLYFRIFLFGLSSLGIALTFVPSIIALLRIGADFLNTYL